MTKQMYKTEVEIQLVDREGKRSTRVINGYGLKYDDLEFIVHKSHTDNNEWKVTERKTGMSVVSGSRTRKDAVNCIDITINKIGVDKVREKINQVLSR